MREQYVWHTVSPVCICGGVWYAWEPASMGVSDLVRVCACDGFVFSAARGSVRVSVCSGWVRVAGVSAHHWTPTLPASVVVGKSWRVCAPDRWVLSS